MTCHGSDLSGGNGPACRACHAGEGLDNTAQLSNCRTCHGNPPPGVPPLSQPAGYPNLAGAHAKHAALSGVACATCHTGAGMPPAPAVQTSLLHFDNVLQVAFAAGYNARSGILGYAAATRSCTATICHGGQPTPDWRRTPATLACTGCHKSSATAPLQYNDWSNVPFGEHTFHIGRFGTGNSCTICHDAAYLAVAANHYPNPKATTFRNPPASLRASLNYAPPGSSKSNCSTGGIPNPAGGTYSCH
jgi:predicted CxxxxCH...CXXCH cytochrome family protein